MLERDKKIKIAKTDEHEILVVLGCCLIMSYNKVPRIQNYWSVHPSLANSAIKNAISRDRFQLLMSKMYFNDPRKPSGCSKLYYIEEIVSCVKKTFPSVRTESTFQAIDESMAKFKGRSSLKQYQPLKPIKRGIKLWLRCDSKTGFVYDLNIYSGKEESVVVSESTLGERVVEKLCNTIRSTDVMIGFDRFFTSSRLINFIDFPAVGTVIKTRKNIPKFTENLKRNESEFMLNCLGTIASRWIDSKEVIVLSNCHTPTTRKQKTGEKMYVDCPDAIITYVSIMGGVDIADQKVGVYDLNRKSTKWWKKVFFKILMMAVVNAWIVHQETNHKKTELISFMVPLAEDMIEIGRRHCKTKKGYHMDVPQIASEISLT